MTTLFSSRLGNAFLSLLIGLSMLAGFATQAARAQQPATAEAARDDYLLGPGDAIRIQVFQNPDLTVEARVSEAGAISFPLLGALRVGGLSPTSVERVIAQMSGADTGASRATGNYNHPPPQPLPPLPAQYPQSRRPR